MAKVIIGLTRPVVFVGDFVGSWTLVWGECDHSLLFIADSPSAVGPQVEEVWRVLFGSCGRFTLLVFWRFDNMQIENSFGC